MTMVSNELISRALTLYLKKAAKNRENAGYAGAMSDYGASAMEGKVQAYVDGWNKNIPDWLKPYYEEVINPKNAEEKALYEQLKKKYDP